MIRLPFPMLLVAVATICGSAWPVRAQDSPGVDPPAHVAFVEGAVVLERDGVADPSPASMPLLAGDRLRTQAGRAEVLFADGSALHLDASTIVDFQSDEVVRLLQGRIRLAIAGPARDLSYRVDAPSAWVQINDPGEYRIAVLGEGEVELAVLRGAAELVNEAGRSFIRAGERTFARNGAAPSPPYVFNSAAWDEFDRWSEERRDQRLGASAQYLPPDVRPYASTLDAHGSWRYEQAHGYVWYPRVHLGWRPYHHGRWASLRPYGWTWVAADPWGWPTHHYGRWGLSAGAWYWIPGRQWGPAWVSWAYAPDYVSWAALGWNNRPVIQIVNVNVYGGRRYDPWHAWTVVPRRHFSAPYVHVTRVAAGRIGPRVHASFVVRDRGPEPRYAVDRSRAPIRSAGRYAVPRSGGASALSGAGTRPDAGRSAAPAGQDRRFPAAARTPGAPTSASGDARQRNGAAPAAARPAPSQRPGAAVPRAAAVPGARVQQRGRSSQPDAGAANRQEPGSPPAVSSAPAGAVRAMPRGGSSTEGTATAPARREFRRTAPASRPRAVVSPQPAPADRAPDGAVRLSPRTTRQTPESAPAPEARRGVSGARSAPPPNVAAPAPERARPRSGAAPAGPAYRSAPARRGPSGPPPSATPSAPAPEAGRSGATGGSRRGGGERSAAGEGGARRRR